MNTATLSAFAALSGSAIGAGASFATTWLTQHYQDRQQRLSLENTRRERLFGDFIEAASRLLADALVAPIEDPARLVPLYAVLGKLRLFASRETIAAADHVMYRILVTSRSPALQTAMSELHEEKAYDMMRDFTECCRAELR
ncbi:MAG: hypothetical protein INR65_00285 [Gluconacetobacter diazotrophicus]|nr:hypothetical protein [Gluconacetobacter diazotrophicus]